MNSTLKRLYILQEFSNKGSVKKGKGFSYAMRFNPYNPLSYVAAILLLLVHLVLHGLLGVWNDFDNPFMWH